MDNLDFEHIDDDVRAFWKEETGKFYKISDHYYDKIRKDVSRFTFQERIRNASVNNGTLAVIKSSKDGFRLILGEKEFYSTSKMILWSRQDSTGHRTAIFESDGSDYGRLLIFRDTDKVYQEDGWIWGLAFTDDDFYVVKETRSESPNKENPVSPSIYHGKNVVFGDQVKEGEDVDIHIFGNMASITVQNATSGSVYTGLASDPSTWKLYRKFDTNFKVLGFRGKVPLILVRSGNGKILSGSGSFDLPKPVEDVVKIREGYLILLMEDACIVPILMGEDGTVVRKFKMDQPTGLISLDSDGKEAVAVMTSFTSTHTLVRFRKGDMVVVDENSLLDSKVEQRISSFNGIRLHWFFIKAENDSKNTLVYGYGGFSISLTPSFNPLFAYLLESGVNVAVCNLPGGSEYGEEWHKLGMRENKKNVYGSFQKIIVELREEGHDVICYGVSNGGLLSAYTLAAIPEKLAGSVIGNPVTDLMTFHRLLAGKYWVDEYGNPDNPDDAEFLESYSAFHRLGPGKYPPVLIYTRSGDDRVHPSHALKFYKKLKEFGGNAYIMVGEGGHLGSGMEDITSEIARIATFTVMVFRGNIN